MFQRPITDWDVTTSASTREIKTIFSDVKFFALKHGIVTLVHSKQHFDVTPFRGKFGSLEEDLARRDFTINAMAFDPEKTDIIDPFNGQMDIQSKQIRAVGNPKVRFQEDPLRLLRAVRLATELKFKIEVATLETMPYMADLLQKVATERIREEFTKILMSPKPSTGFDLMRRTGLLKHFLPELLEGYRKTQNTHHRYTIYRHIQPEVDLITLPTLQILNDFLYFMHALSWMTHSNVSTNYRWPTFEYPDSMTIPIEDVIICIDDRKIDRKYIMHCR